MYTHIQTGLGLVTYLASSPTAGAVSLHRHTFSKVLYIVALYSKCTGSLTFENLFLHSTHLPKPTLGRARVVAGV